LVGAFPERLSNWKRAMITSVFPPVIVVGLEGKVANVLALPSR
jgi:hypothetical protein